jgi:phosphate transport system substrate-binding protein
VRRRFIEAGENDNLIVQKLRRPGTVGIFGYSYLEENQDKLKGLLDQRRRPDL